MPSYPKIWTSTLNDEWFIGLSLSARGVWFQLILLAKQNGDNSVISSRSWTALGSVLGCDGKTARKILGKFRENGKITLKVLDTRVIVVTIPNYIKYQEVKTGDQLREISRKIPQNGENSAINEDEIKGNEDEGKPSATYDPEIIKKTHKIKYDDLKTPYENLKIWNKSEESDELEEIFSATPGYELEWVNHVFSSEFEPWVSMEPEKAKDSLFNKHNGSWQNMFKSWVRRSKKGNSYSEYFKSRVR